MKLKNIIRSLSIFAAGFGFSLIVVYFLNPGLNLPDVNIIRDRDEYEYVSPLLMCGISEQVESTDFADLKTSVEKELAPLTKTGDTVSVYFRELDSGEWFSINSEETFSPASLLKLPLFIAYMKGAESEPEILNQEVTLDENNWNEKQTFLSENPTLPGQTYTVSELLTAMVKKSDNNAAVALNSGIDINFRNEVYTDLGISIPSDDAVEQFMTAKDYSHFFRILYNASYLSHENSEKTLEMMTEARFPEGLASGIPESTSLAEKFGERMIKDSDNNVLLYELHDCGIIYTADPYLLCVMTKSYVSFEHLSELIETISRTVYNEMTSPRAETFSVVES